ncbi:MAG: hypothetical protein H6718_10640 [Polyangiaceae bacterium]|nr:hypothetical protein [Myxococcales bacterium]MCB9585844.1 hypothetical protein [Polyangiaceae bacterium]MCB9607227.1 hypothetical protein [Polyangiaceae bacterium]
MVQAKFDPALALKFDLGRGTLSQVGGGSRVILPADVLTRLLEGASEQVCRDVGQHLGTDLGRRAGLAMGDSDTAAPERVLEFLGGELALMGLGSLGFERWGRALVFSVVDSPFGTSADSFMAALFDGAMLRLYGKTTSSICLGRVGKRVRFLVSGESAAKRVKGWLDSGVHWGEVLSRLQSGGDA